MVRQMAKADASDLLFRQQVQESFDQTDRRNIDWHENFVPLSAQLKEAILQVEKENKPVFEKFYFINSTTAWISVRQKLAQVIVDVWHEIDVLLRRSILLIVLSQFVIAGFFL